MRLNFWPLTTTTKKHVSWHFFGLIPCRDKKLDSVLDGKCPDCALTSFNVETSYGVTFVKCVGCCSKFMVSPICVERIND